MAAQNLTFFDDIQTQLDTESERREQLYQIVKALDRACRLTTASLNRVHADPARLAREVASQVEVELVSIRKHLHQLSELIPEHKFFKYCDMWSKSLQQACFLSIMTVYLKEERLGTMQDIETLLQVKVDMKNEMTDFHITVEDYLHAVCMLITELSRMAINAVTAGDVALPFRISAFVKDLNAGCQLLNLKNDSLRRRFDGIKYDVKRIEEVVYDLTLRGLKPTT